MIKKCSFFSIVFSICLVNIQCQKKNSQSSLLEPEVKSVETISISPESATISEDDTVSFHIIVNYDDGSTERFYTGVDWASTNSSICTVSENGLVTGVKAGQAEISANYASHSDNASVTVEASTTNGWVTLFSDDFERADLYPKWENSKHSGGYRWGTTEWISFTGQRSAWCVANSDDGYPDIDPENGPYADNTETWMILKDPVDLRYCNQVKMSVKLAYWTECGYDYLSIYASAGDQDWLYVDDMSGKSPHKVGSVWEQWQQREYYFTNYNTLKTLLGHAVVYLAFRFYSDSDNSTCDHRLRGAFVDDVLLEKYVVSSSGD